MTISDPTLPQLCINTIRTLSIDAIQKADSGHPGLPMGAAPMAHVLWQCFLRHNPNDPKWPDRDRFVLSAGHGSMLLYSLLHLSGYDLSLDDIKNFRQWHSKTPGHPESCLTPGVEATTGPLGQGLGNAVGMAICERALAHHFNRPDHTIVDHFTYVLVGDGDLMEGITAEASSLAGHLRLGKLICLYDSNDISLDGPTSLSFSEDVGKRYEAYGWQVLTVTDGDNDLAAIHDAIRSAREEIERPSLIIVKTTIGFGSPNKQGTSGAHGAPLGIEEVALTKKTLGWLEPEPFAIPEPALAHFREARARGETAQSEWRSCYDRYARAFPELANQWQQSRDGVLPEGWDGSPPTWTAGRKIATRVASGQALNAFAAQIPWLMGGDADLSCSTKTALEGADSFNGSGGAGRNLHFGVREHAMGAIANGICYHGGMIPYTATFLCFADYMRPAIRLAALSGLGSIFVFTHDSIAVGEDGPTHQPVEHLASLRSIPNLTLFRPADATEALEAWRFALRHREGPVVLVFSRQGLPVIDRGRLASATMLHQGGYILSEAQGGDPEAILIATGSEVSLALRAQQALAAEEIQVRVVSLPSWERFASRPRAYRQSVLPEEVSARLAIEAGSSFGWHRWIGDRGAVLGVDGFGASAPGDVVLERYGFSVEQVCRRVRELLGGRGSAGP